VLSDITLHEGQSQRGRSHIGPQAPRSWGRLGGGIRLAVLAASALACLVVPAVAQATPSEGIHNIKHVVMIMQENRSFDSYFGTYPGAQGIPAGVCLPDPVNGGCQAPFHDPTDRNFGGPHGGGAAVNDINGGRMDGFVASVEKGLKCTPGEARCLPCNSPQASGKCVGVMGYHDAREIPNYWAYAKNFVLQDQMFQSAASWSEPEHYYMVSGWSAICPPGDNNPLDCVNRNPESVVTSPHTWTDVTYMLNKAKVSWRYYLFEGAEPDCASDEAIVCEPGGQTPKTLGIWNPLPGFTDVKEDGQLENIQSLTNFYSAVHEPSTCGLPNVAWVVPNDRVSEHPPSSISKGQAYVTTLINSIMRSPCWGSTAVFLSWDDWSGFYDHAIPPVVDQNGYGLRVPGLVISPYAKTGYVDHQRLSHDAYLKFIEDDFLSGARLNPATDGRPDRRPDVREEAPGLGDLANVFDFNQTPRRAVLLSPHPEPGPPSTPPGSNPPTAQTGTASSATATSATLEATVNPNGGAVSDCRFEYGTSASYGSSVPCTSLPPPAWTSMPVSAQVAGLSGNTTYHFRIVAGDTAGEAHGEEATFKTLPSPPTVQTAAASTVKATSATLNATVNPNEGDVSDCRFDYGTSASYGSSVACAALPGSGAAPAEVSGLAAQLTPNTTYHFRSAATNAGGTGVSGDRTFTTEARAEFGRCVRVAKGVRGRFATAGCTSPATAEQFAFEWEAGPGSNAGFTTSAKAETALTLETVRKVKVTCKGEVSSGEYTGPTTVGGVVVTLTGCEALLAKCTSAGAAEGEIVTSTLEGVLGWEAKEEHRVALDLFPVERGGLFTEFVCGGTSMAVRGSVISPVISGRMQSTTTVKYAATAGRQKPEHLEGEPNDVLESSLLGGSFEQTGLTLTTTLTNAEPIEVNWFV
jgi:phospholipase C